MNISTALEQAYHDSKTLAKKPDNDILLQMYSLYKQATVGDAPEDATFNMFDFVAKAKHDAWVKLKGMDAEQASQQYIDLVQSLKSQEGH
jgi:diazepam-binding inhibitor (GABA receptor modulating acyl-CoA-binding protein)